MTFPRRLAIILLSLLSLILGGIFAGLHWLACQGIAAGRAVAWWIARRM